MNLRGWSAFLKHDSHEYRIKLGFFGRENIVNSHISQKSYGSDFASGNADDAD